MGAVLRQADRRLRLATGPVIKKTMPQGLTFHTSSILFHGHYDVPPESPAEQGTPHHLNHNCRKGKMAGCSILHYQFEF